MIEEWKVVPGYEDYKVSNFGNCISNRRRNQITMKPHYDDEGYVQYVLRNSNGRKMYKANRLVSRLFGELEDINDTRLLSCHIDDNPRNNRIDNLFVGTQSENQFDCVRKGRNNPSSGQKHGASKLKDIQISEIRELLSLGIKHTHICELYDVARPTITKIALGNTRKHL